MQNEEVNELILLAEIRAISERSSASSRFVGANNLMGDNDQSFLGITPENANYNQYWYSNATVEVLTKAILEILNLAGGKKIAFLSTPSLYFALPEEKRVDCKVFEFDTVWQNDIGFVHYDFNKPEALDPSLKNMFDMVVIDPPFIEHEVWKKYAMASRFLLKNDPNPENSFDIQQKGIVMGTTVKENKDLMMQLFGAKPTEFLPVCPNLVYQFAVYVNCIDECSTLQTLNPELPSNC